MNEPTPKPGDTSGESAFAERKTGPELSPAVARRVRLSLELEKALAINTPEVVAAHAKLVAAVLGPDERVRRSGGMELRQTLKALADSWPHDKRLNTR